MGSVVRFKTLMLSLALSTLVDDSTANVTVDVEQVTLETRTGKKENWILKVRVREGYLRMQITISEML